MTITPLSPGARLKNRYQIIKLLGRGGQCIVYLTYDQFTAKNLVVKCLVDQSTDYQERTQNLKLFLKEHIFLSKLAHPSLPKAYEHFEEGGKHYLVVDFVPGQNLEQVLKSRTGPITEKEAIDWGIQVAKTLNYLSHQKPNPVVIRDIKPSNIQYTPDKKLMLIDFSIAREWKPVGKDTVRMGSPGYAAPEQYRGNSDIRSDIYSLGVTLYEALTKIDPTLTPFKYQPVRQINPGVSVEMERILLKAMDTDKDTRYQHPKEMLEDLKALSELGKLSNSDKAKKYFYMGETELGAKNYKKALEYYEQAVKYESCVGEYRARLGEVHYLMGNLETGLKEIYQGIAGGFIGLLQPDQINEIRKKYEIIKKELIKSWPMFSKNLSRTSCQTFETELSPPVAVLWQSDIFDIPPKSSPAVTEDMLFIGTKTGRMLCVDLNSGNIKWTVITSNAIISSPTFHKGTVYFGSNDSNVYALEAVSGRKKWTFKTGGAVFSSPAVYRDTVYIGSSDNKLYALRTSNGTKSWEFDSKSSIISSPSIWDDKIFFANMSGSVFSVNALNGQINWIFDAGGPVSASPSIENSMVYVGCFDGNIYAIDTTTGKARWTFKTHRKIETNAAVADGIVYVTSSDYNVYAFDAFKGSKLWHYRAESSILASPVVANNILYVLTNYLYCLANKTGKLIWQMNVPGPSHSTPAIANSTIYFNSGKTLFSCGPVTIISEKLYKEGNELLKTNQYLKAAESYKKALALIRKKEYLEGLARAYYLLNDDNLIDETIKTVKELIIVQYSPTYSLWLGDLYFRKREYDEALDNYQKALQTDSTLDWAYFRTGLINYKFKANPEKAIELIQKATKLNQSNPLYLKTLGEVYQNIGRIAEAITTYTVALSQNPGDSEIKGNLTSLKLAMETRKAFEQGKDLMSKGRIDDAIKAFEKAIAGLSRPEYHFELAKAYLAIKDRRFMAQFDKVFKEKPDEKDYLLLAGKTSLEQLKEEGKSPDKEKLEWTVNVLKKLVTLAYDMENHILLAESLFLYEKYEEALAEYLKIKKTDEKILYRISQCYIRTGKQEDAVKSLYNLISVAPGKPLYYKNLGFLLLKLKKEKEAIAILKKALELSPEDSEIREKFSEIKKRHEEAEAFFLEGSEKLQMYQLEECINLFNKAIERIPAEGKFYHKLAEAYLYSKNYPKAKEIINKAINLSPENHSYIALLGNIFTGAKEYGSAISVYRKAIEKSPATVDYYLKLGEIYEKTGDMEESIKEFRKASSIDPENQSIKQRIEILESYQGVKRWPMSGREVSRNSYQEKEKTLTPPTVLRWGFLKENWVFETQGKINSSPVIDNGIVYTGSCDKYLYAFDINSGEKKWQNSTGGEILATPLVYKNCIYTGSNDGIFYAFDAISGRFLWMYNSCFPIVASPIIIKDIIYIITNKGILYALNIPDGQPRWMKDFEAPVLSSPSAEKNILYISITNGKICAMDITDGRILWERNLSGKITSNVIVKDNFLYTGSWDKNFYGLKKENGEVVWSFKTGGKITASPATDGKNVFFGSEDKKVYSLNASTGELKWEHKTRGPVVSTPAIANNIVYIGSDDGKIYALETTTGRPWEYKTGGAVKSSPAIAESMLFIGSDDGKLYCFRNYRADETPLPTTGEEEKSWWKKIF